MIKLMLHDDWEIYMNGSGDPKSLMFDKAKEILDICDKYGAKYTFFAEVGQQFAMLESNHKEHRVFAQEWENILKNAIKRGHDVQLHFHPQWIGAKWENGEWQLDLKNQSIAKMTYDEIYFHLLKGKNYLSELLSYFNYNHEVLAFRAGGWMNQPSTNLIKALVQCGIKAEVSIVNGKLINAGFDNIIDFRDSASNYQPWFPNIYDIKGKNDPVERSLFCIPTYSKAFNIPLPLFLLLKKPFSYKYYLDINKKVKKSYAEKSGYFTPPSKINYLINFFTKKFTYGSYGYIHYSTLLKMIREVANFQNSKEYSWLPMIMLTHSKSFHSLENFENLLQKLSEDRSIVFSTTYNVINELMLPENKKLFIN